jgi:ABC-type multidrug transport system fused ATPase/permease subunit
MDTALAPAPPAGLRRLASEFLRPHRSAILLALAGMLVQSMLLLPVPLLQGWVLDRLTPLFTGRPAADLPSRPQAGGALGWMVAGALALSVLCHLGRMALAWRASAVMTRVSLEVVRALTDALHRKLQRLPLAYFDRQQTGRVMARITNDVGTLLIFLNSGSLQLVSDLVLAGGIAAVLLGIRWQLALVSFAALPLYALNHRFFARRLQELSRMVRGQVAGIYALLSERVSAVRVVRSFAQEEAEVAAFDRRLDDHRGTSWAGTRTGSLQGLLAALTSGLGMVAVLSYSAALAADGRLTVGELLAFYALVAQLYNPIVRLTQFHGVVAATRVAVERMAEVLAEPETVSDRPGALPVRRPRGALAFRDVTFGYTPDGPLVLDRVSLDIEPGTTVGVLGRSGAGKSTLLALAPRLYDVAPGRGAVLFDGQDVRDLKAADLRRAVALVPQQALLFEGTFRSNLAYAAPDAGEARVRRVLEAVQLAGLVDSLPQGLDTPVGERGYSLSGGQRQRLALARALLADPAVFLLDDCTSALDAETEARVQAALRDILPGRTCVIVSHKVASVRRADRIVVLEAGRVVEEGTHDELVARGGLYADTFERQANVLALPRREAV